MKLFLTFLKNINYHPIFFIMLFFYGFTSVGTNSQQSPYEIMATTKKKEIDIDGDGTPDVFRKYKNNRLIELTYAPSRYPGTKEVTTYESLKKYVRKVYDFNELIEETHVTPTSDGYITDTFSYLPKKYRLKKTVTYKLTITDKYIWKNKSWKPVQHIETINEPTENEVTTSPTTSSSTKNGAITDVPVIGFRIDNSCNSYDKKILAHATNKIFSHHLPCLGKRNSTLSLRMLTNILTYKNLIHCHAVHPTGKDSVAFTYFKNDSDIYYTSHTPSLLGKIHDTNQVINLVADTLFHESFHNLGFPHKKDSSGLFKGLVFGCERLCALSNYSFKHTNLKESCESCIDQGKNIVSLLASKIQKKNKLCKNEPPLHRQTTIIQTNSFKDICLSANGAYNNYSCKCPATGLYFNPRAKSCN